MEEIGSLFINSSRIATEYSESCASTLPSITCHSPSVRTPKPQSFAPHAGTPNMFPAYHMAPI
eukprot:9774541-Karenia_brevis.AAC.1